MKYFFPAILLLLFAVKSFGQTREADYNYIISHFLDQANNPNYLKRSITSSEFPIGNNRTANLQFFKFKTLNDDIERGIAVVYKLRNDANNQLLKYIVLCFPEKNSSGSIKERASRAINDIDDIIVVKYILMGMVNIGVD